MTPAARIAARLEGEPLKNKRPRAMTPAARIAARLEGEPLKNKRPRAMDGRGRVKWRRGESNPCPVMFQRERLRVYPVDLSLVHASPAGRVRREPARNVFGRDRTRR